MTGQGSGVAITLKVGFRGTRLERVKIYTPARLAEFERNNEQALAGRRVKPVRNRKHPKAGRAYPASKTK
jgi:hypothetical protein